MDSKEAQHVKMNLLGLIKYFDTVFVPEEVGVHKPDPKIFLIMPCNIQELKRWKTV